MLLNIIKEEDNTSKIVYFVLPTDNSLTTNNDIIRTAYYYRTTVFKVPQCHVGYCNGVTDIHRIMWLIHTTFVDVEAVVIVKPSTVINPPKRILIEEIVDKVSPFPNALYNSSKFEFIFCAPNLRLSP